MAVDDTTSTDLETVDTSAEADTSAVDSDADLEDIEVDLTDITDNDEEEQETDTSEESDSDDESSEETDESDDTTEEETESELSDDDKRKQVAREHYEQRQAEKQARIARVTQDQADYIADAAENRDPLELAVRQLQVSEYNNTVESMSNRLTNGYEKALVDFPVLQTKDPVIQAEIDATIDAFQAQHVTIDAYGNPTAVRGDLYATLQAKANSIEKLTGIRAQRQEQSKGKEKSKTLTTPTRAPKQAKVDADMAAFDEEAYS